MKRLTLQCCTLLILMNAGLAMGQTSNHQSKAVAERVQSYLDAFNGRDLNACAEHWSINAEYLVPDSSTQFQGRDAIRKAIEKLLATDEQFKLSLSDQRFRVVSPDTVLEEGTAELVSEKHGMERASYLVVHVRKNGQWFRNSVRETAIGAPPVSPLKELAGLLGDWQKNGGKGSLSIHGREINDGHFISRTFTASNKDGDKLSGTQIIGWDPSTHSIRSWSFDSEGGWEQAEWIHQADCWLVKVNAVLPDGSRGSEQRVLKLLEDGKLTSEVIEQQVAGRLLPATDKVTLVRQAQK